MKDAGNKDRIYCTEEGYEELIEDARNRAMKKGGLRNGKKVPSAWDKKVNMKGNYEVNERSKARQKLQEQVAE